MMNWISDAIASSCIDGTICQGDGHFGRYIFTSLRHPHDRMGHIIRDCALQEIALSTCFECTKCFNIALIGRHGADLYEIGSLHVAEPPRRERPKAIRCSIYDALRA